MAWSFVCSDINSNEFYLIEYLLACAGEEFLRMNILLRKHLQVYNMLCRGPLVNSSFFNNTFTNVSCT